MAFISIFDTLGCFFKVLALSWTAHARIASAAELRDYDKILEHIREEVKFHIGSLLSILFFVATLGDPNLISWTLICLLFSLVILILFDGMPGEAIHRWIDEIPCGRVLLALLVKLPTLAVLGTVCALSRNQWDGPFTRGAFYALIIIVAVVVLLMWLKTREDVVRSAAMAVARWPLAIANQTVELWVSFYETMWMWKAGKGREEDAPTCTGEDTSTLSGFSAQENSVGLV